MSLEKYNEEKFEKQRTYYEKHKELFLVIYLLGNKVALQKQVEEILLHFNIYKSSEQFRTVIDTITVEEEGKQNKRKIDLREKKKLNNSNIIVMKNPAIRWIAEDLNKTTDLKFYNSQSVGKKLTEDAVFLSMFKMEHFIKYMKNKNIRANAQGLRKALLDSRNWSSITYTKSKGYEFMNLLVENNNINQQPHEFDKVIRELEIKREKKSEVVPDRNGKTKEYTEKLRSDREKGINRTNNNAVKKKKTDEYTMNSIFDAKDLILEFDRYEEYERVISSTNVVTDYNMYFNLYVLDLNNSIGYKSLGDITRKTYLMLRETFGEETVYITKHDRCMECPYYVHGEKYKKSNLDKFGNKIQGCYPGTEHQRQGCKEPVGHFYRDIYLQVIYVGRNEERRRELMLNCNKTIWENGEKRDYHNIKHRVVMWDKNAITKDNFEDFIVFDYKSYDIDSYGRFTGLNNLDEYNKEKKRKAIEKERQAKVREAKKFAEDKELLELLMEEIKSK